MERSKGDINYLAEVGAEPSIMSIYIFIDSGYLDVTSTTVDFLSVLYGELYDKGFVFVREGVKTG